MLEPNELDEGLVEFDPDRMVLMAILDSWFKLVTQATLRSFPSDKSLTVDDLPEVGRTLLTNADNMYADVKKRMPDVSECGLGCSWCCYLEVKATQPEVAAIAVWLQDSLSAEAFAALKDKIKATAIALKELDSASRIPFKIPCSFLDVETGTCRVYRFRPLVCRGFNSVSRKDCEAAWGVPDTTTQFEAFRQGTYEAVQFGAIRGLKFSGLDYEPRELNQALAECLGVWDEQE